MKVETPRETARFSPYEKPKSSQPSSQHSSQLSPGNQENTPPTSGATCTDTPTSSQTLPGPYRFDFGKHRGKILDECGQIYIDWLIKNDVPSSRPNLKDALAKRTSSLSTPSKPAVSRAPLTPLSSSNPQPTNLGLSYSIEARTRPGECVLPFGKYKGMKLDDIDDSAYLHWVAEQICEGSMKLDPALVKSLTDMGYTTSYNSGLTPLKPDYRSPDLDKAPTVFRENRGKGRCAWITETDVKIYFGVGPDYLARLPRANPNAAKSAAQATYYVYHVWDLVKEHGTKEMADEKRVAFSKKNRGTDNFTAKDRVERGLPARKMQVYPGSNYEGGHRRGRGW